jgi:ribonuclease HI
MLLPTSTVHLYTDATPSSIAAITTTPVSAFYRRLEPAQPIAVAEMAAALVGLHWYLQDVALHPTTVILYTDSSVVYHSLSRGTGLTLRSHVLLQNLNISFLINKVYTGHGLVVRWVPSCDNLADPLSRGVHALQQGTAL